MKTLVIEESKWLHGNKWKSLLLNSTGEMCCLGFLAKSYGATDDEIRIKGTPENTTGIAWHPALFNGQLDSSLCRQIVVVNDRDETTDCEFDPELLKKKKQDLTELFAVMDIELKFVP